MFPARLLFGRQINVVCGTMASMCTLNLYSVWRFWKKDNRVSILPLHHYEWKGQPKTFQYPKTVLSFGRNTADGERCRRTGAYRPRLNMKMGHLW